MDQYLEDRRAKGYNAIQTVIITEGAGLTGPNRYGHSVMINGDVTRPNSAYFSFVDLVIEKARAKGIIVMLLPSWGFSISKFNTTTAYDFGRYLADRYADKTNVIWSLGGDKAPDYAIQQVWRAMANGLNDGGADQIKTFHTQRGSCSYNFFPNDSWLDFSICQSGHGSRNYHNQTLIMNGLSQSPLRPMIDGEPRYENIAVNHQVSAGYFDDYDTRQAAYWAVFAGAAGHTYGNHAIWQWDHPVLGLTGNHVVPKVRYWFNAMNMDGSKDMQHLRTLMDARPALSRMPDQGLIVTNYSGMDNIQAMKSPSSALIYTATGKPVDVRMGRISGQEVLAHWFNPRTGDVIYAGKFANSGTRIFTPSSSGRGNDWVLLLDDASKTFVIPK